jgi:hypothetical protein
MNLSRLISLVIVVGCFLNMLNREGLEAALLFSLVCLALLSLIWRAGWWINFMAPFGWWGGRRPSDLDNPAYHLIIPLFGWACLLLLFFLSS